MESETGFFWHGHHDTLVEFCFDRVEGVRQILSEKPENERELRLRLFKPVKENLPEELVQAGQTLKQTEQAYSWALRAYSQEWRIYLQALENHKSFLENLHKIECPDCPWNGHTIFSKAA